MSHLPSRWSADNSAAGQCTVTALLIQELLGGRIVYGELNGVEHYWNYLPSEEELDPPGNSSVPHTLSGS